MFDLQLFRPAGDPPTAPADLAAALVAAGATLDGDSADPYRPGRWRHVATGARALIDLGEPPLERDDQHPPRSYAGWAPDGMALHLPLAGPHWQAVEALALAEAVLAAHPRLRFLDLEDVISAEGAQPGPFPWHRPRVIASWEAQRSAHAEGLQLPALARPFSVRLWRYRRERPAARTAHGDLHWPDALVLLDTRIREVRTACLWNPADGPLALPPVELAVVQRHDGGSAVVLAESLRSRALPTILPAGAVAITEQALGDQSLCPAQEAGLKALLDEDWRD
jgi:hypothetical protein